MTLQFSQRPSSVDRRGCCVLEEARSGDEKPGDQPPEREGGARRQVLHPLCRMPLRIPVLIPKQILSISTADAGETPHRPHQEARVFQPGLRATREQDPDVAKEVLDAVDESHDANRSAYRGVTGKLRDDSGTQTPTQHPPPQNSNPRPPSPPTNPNSTP